MSSPKVVHRIQYAPLHLCQIWQNSTLRPQTVASKTVEFNHCAKMMQQRIALHFEELQELCSSISWMDNSVSSDWKLVINVYTVHQTSQY